MWRLKHTKCESKSTETHTSRSSNSRGSSLGDLRRNNSGSRDTGARSTGDDDAAASSSSRGSRRSNGRGDRAGASRVEGALNGEVAPVQDLTDIVIVHVVVVVGVDVELCDAGFAVGDQGVGVRGVADALKLGIIVV